MKHFLAAIILASSFAVYAEDLQDGDVVRLDYNDAPVYRVSRVEKTVSSVVYSGTRYYTARLRFHVIAEGNTCGGLRSSLGARHKYDDDKILIRLQTGTRKTSEMSQCAEYSKETRVIIPEVMDLGTSEPQSQVYDFGGSSVNVIWKDRKLTTVITNPTEER